MYFKLRCLDLRSWQDMPYSHSVINFQFSEIETSARNLQPTILGININILYFRIMSQLLSINHFEPAELSFKTF